MSYVDACLMCTTVRDFLTRHLPKYFHFRIYFLLFPLKYPKIVVGTPGFGPKTGFLRHKLCKYICCTSAHRQEDYGDHLQTWLTLVLAVDPI